MKYLLFFMLLGNQTFCQTPIDKKEIIIIGGIKQFIQLKGKDDSKPLLLFLHGGPGSSLISKSEQFTAELQQHFIVVQWDQRETGETLRLNKTNQALKIDLFYNDTHELIDSLLKKFRRDKLYLAGYSWGSGMGFYIADKYPELLFAYIAISPVINQWESEKIALEMLKSKVNRKGRDELSQVRIPFENVDQLYYHRKWLFSQSGQKFVGITFPRSVIQAWGVTWFNVWTESCGINRFESLKTIKCPVYFFTGDKDYQTNYNITQQYFSMLSAPRKDLFLFAGSGHTLPETDPGLFQEIIIKKILPDTFTP